MITERFEHTLNYGTGLNRILIVDDNYADVRYLSHLLNQSSSSPQSPSYEIKSVSTAATGLRTCQNWLPNCILLDYKLPDMSGLHFMELMSDEIHDSPMAVIMLTGFGDETTAVQAMKLGASDYLVKSELNGLKLQQTIRQAYETAELLHELRQKREELTLFAERLAHDLITPLHSLGIHTEFVAELFAEGKEQALIAENLKTINEISAQLVGFVHNLHDYTTAGRVDIDSEPLDFMELVQKTLTILKPELGTRATKIQINELPVVMGSRIDLMQLLQNLISNAIKYNDKDVLELQFCAQAAKKGAWQITISDNGIGIPTQEKDIIFEPSKRTSTAQKFDGSGLGLSTCRKIVESHGGKIWVDSELGYGTSVHFLLPGS